MRKALSIDDLPVVLVAIAAVVLPSGIMKIIIKMLAKHKKYLYLQCC